MKMASTMDIAVEKTGLWNAEDTVQPVADN